MPTRQAPSPEPLADFLDDWRVHLRAKDRALRTIESYLAVGRTFCDYLAANGLLAVCHADQLGRSRRMAPTGRGYGRVYAAVPERPGALVCEAARGRWHRRRALP
jgi:hypothetical protein